MAAITPRRAEDSFVQRAFAPIFEFANLRKAYGAQETRRR